MVYQPRLDREHVRRLYELKEATGVPMTVIVNRILAEFFEVAASGPRECPAIAKHPGSRKIAGEQARRR